jgi:hypothetical protein
MNPETPIRDELATLCTSTDSSVRELASTIDSAIEPLLTQLSDAGPDALMVQSKACVRLGETLHVDSHDLFREAQELAAQQPESTPQQLGRRLLSYLASHPGIHSRIRSLAEEMLKERYGTE